MHEKGMENYMEILLKGFSYGAFLMHVKGIETYMELSVYIIIGHYTDHTELWA